MSTNVRYTPYDQIPRELTEGLEGFLRQIFTKTEHLNFVLQEIASGLDSTPNQNRFFLFTGMGANGKSTLMNLLNGAMGNYSGETAITLFTHARPPANSPTPELMQIRGKRFVSCSEPNSRDTLNLGTIKWLTGGDRITARDLYQSNVSFYPQATFFCLTNDIPPMDTGVDDWGTWRRIKPVTFDSKFVSVPRHKNEFVIDPDVNTKIKSWSESFASLLVKTFLSDDVFDTPNEFEQLRRQLSYKNDLYGRFIQDCVTPSDQQIINKQFVFSVFNKWRDIMKISKSVTFDTFEKHMCVLLGPMEENGWKMNLKSY
jgi:P4 family phage/plasmid primase-like protien